MLAFLVSVCRLQPARQALYAAAESHGTLHAVASKFACMSKCVPLLQQDLGSPADLDVLLHGEAPGAASTSSAEMLPKLHCPAISTSPAYTSSALLLPCRPFGSSLRQVKAAHWLFHLAR